MDNLPSPADLVIRPPEAVWIERQPDGGFLIHLAEPAGRITVYLGDTPEVTAAWQPLTVETTTSHELRVARSELVGLAGRRPYFLLEIDGRRHLVAERTLPLAGGLNFRDVGGYRTADGRSVRWGKVYRSGSLAELSDDDVAYLAQLGLRLSCDLRSTEEALLRPDRLPPGAISSHRPVAAEVGLVRRIITLFVLRKRIQSLLQQAYIVMLDQNGPLFAGLLRDAADPANLPLVIHCTAGKDRTGLASAILLLTLGVPEETVIADYTLSNRAYDQLAGRMGSEFEPLYRLGFDEARLRPFLLAEARTLTNALAHLRRRYGSVEQYLLRAGLDEATLEQLRSTLLVTDQ